MVNGSLSLAPIGNLTLTDSGFRINSEGLVARFAPALDAGFGGGVSLGFSVGAVFELNTTGRTQQLGDTTITSGFRLRLDGSVNFLNLATGNGFVEIAMGSFGFSMDFDVQFALGPLSFGVTGGAAVYTGSNAGVAFALQVRAVADAAVFSVDASGTLTVNTP